MNSLVRVLTEALRRKSTLTAVQFEALALRKMVKKGELSAFQAARTREGTRKEHGMTAGSYYRVLSQARSKLERSIFTLMFAARTQSVRGEELMRLLRMVAEAPEEMEDVKVDEFMSVLSTLVKRIVVT